MLLCLYYVLMFFCLKNMLICYYVFIYYSVFFLVILSTNHLFLVKMRNFPKKYLVVRKLYVNLHRKARSSVGGRLNLTLLEETSGQLYGQSRKDVF
jgi:hypothetical protein